MAKSYELSGSMSMIAEETSKMMSSMNIIEEKEHEVMVNLREYNKSVDKVVTDQDKWLIDGSDYAKLIQYYTKFQAQYSVFIPQYATLPMKMQKVLRHQISPLLPEIGKMYVSSYNAPVKLFCLHPPPGLPRGQS